MNVRRLLVPLTLGVATAFAGCSGGEEHEGSATAHRATSEHSAEAGAPHTAPVPSSAALPEGYAAVELDAERVQTFGFRSEPATITTLTREVRTLGVIRTDETRESHVHVKWMGWIDQFFVSYVGQSVKRGDPLFSVYSPDLVMAQQELLVAKARLDSAERSQRPGERESALSLVQTARKKLQLFDISPDAIAAIEKRGEVLRTLTVRAPRSGTVIEKTALPGMYIEPEMELYLIADLSRVWVLADLYEYEVPFVNVGQTAMFTPIGVEGTLPELLAKVVFIAPTVDMSTRTVSVRLELENPEGRLRPGGYGTVRLEIPLGEALTVASDAVLDTGTRQLVFVQTGQGRFEPRSVRLGARAGARVQVLEGLADGEQVVTRAQFMLDSESRLRAAAQAGATPRHGAH